MAKDPTSRPNLVSYEKVMESFATLVEEAAAEEAVDQAGRSEEEPSEEELGESDGDGDIGMDIDGDEDDDDHYEDYDLF